MKNEKGLTLLEVLVVLFLVTLIAGIIFSSLQSVIRYQQTESTKVALQTEANALVTTWQQFHRYCSESYQLTVEKERVSFNQCKTKADEVVLSDHYFDLFEYEIEMEGSQQPMLLPKTENRVIQAVIHVKDREKKNLQVELPTVIQRY